MLLEDMICENKATLVVIDVLNAYLGHQVDGHRDQDVRHALMPLAKVAERTTAAIVVVRHLNKSGVNNPLYRGGGSIGITGAARSILLTAPDPDDNSRARHVLATTACNLAPPSPALAYRLVPSPGNGTVACVEWEGRSAHTSRSLLASTDHEGASQVAELADAMNALVGEEPVPIRVVREELRRQGYGVSIRQLARARDRAGLHHTPPSGFGGERCYFRPGVSPDNADGVRAGRTGTSCDNTDLSLTPDTLRGLSGLQVGMSEDKAVAKLKLAFPGATREYHLPMSSETGIGA